MQKQRDERIDNLTRVVGLPRHVAIIMDGNGRWAKRRSLPRLEGHLVGRESVRSVVRTASRIGIRYLTLYTFSLENWQRSPLEVKGLMMILEAVLEGEFAELNENGVQLRAIGRLDLLPETTRRALDSTMRKLERNDRLILTLALSYGGRAEIIDAAKRAAGEVKNGNIKIEDIDDVLFRKLLYDPELPDPDLLIRTSGEMRISNFLLWQIAYSEILVTDVLWPDFRETELMDGIEAYLKRERRFGL